MRWTEYAIAMLLFSGVSMILLYLIERFQVRLPWNPQHLAECAAGFGVQHRCIVYHEYELAGLFRRNDHELFHADGRACVSQLHVRCDGHSPGDRRDPRDCPARKRNHREFLGGSDACNLVGSAARLRGDCIVFRIARNDSEFQALRYHPAFGPADCASDRRGRKNNTTANNRTIDSAGPGGVPGSYQDVRHERRRIFQCQQRASL